MRLQERVNRFFARSVASMRWLGGDLRAHWASALFSVVVSLLIWIIIEDVGDPEQVVRAPENSGIQVTAVNVPDEYLEPALSTVIVQVRGRQSDVEGLRPEDFRATVDLGDVGSGATVVTLAVKVTSRREGVEVLEVIPATMDVHLIPAFKRQVEVHARVTELPPTGFQIKQVDGREVPPEIDPPLVTILGPQDLVERVARVELDVSLANARSQSYSTSGELVARSEDGNVIDVRLSETRAQATFAIESVFSPVTIGLAGDFTGTPAHGYQVVAVTVNPLTIEISARQEIVEGFTGPLLLDPVDITDATDTVTQVINIEQPENVTTDTRTAIVTVEIAPIMAERMFYTSVSVTDMPAGLTYAPGTVLGTEVVISGTLNDVDALTEDSSGLRATISLSGAQAGVPFTAVPVVATPGGIRMVSVSQVTVTLIVASP